MVSQFEPEQFSGPEDDEPGQSDLVFECRTDDGRRLTNMLASICLSSRQRDASSTLAWCEIEDDKITFTVGVAKSLQAVAYVKREGIFHKWYLSEEHRRDHPAQEKLEFGINLATLLECLRIFGGAAVGGGGSGYECKAQLHISYRASTACLNLCLVEGHSVTECEIHTLDIEEPHRVCLSLAEGEDRYPARIVVSSEALKSGIDELEWGGDTNKDKRVLLRVTARPGVLSLTVSSTDVGCEMVYPENALIGFDATRDLTFEYRFLHLHMALRSLKDSHQTQLQVDHNGVLEIKMKFSAAASRAAELFSHFFLFPLLEDEDPVEDASGDPSGTATTSLDGARDPFDGFS